MTSSTEAVVHGLRDSKREDSDIWSSRSAFYFAAVGAAVGFGNVWRFPALSVEYGGGAFFIPYFMAFFIIGIPILVLEIGFGQFWQTGDVGVFGGFNSRLRGVGVASVACGWMLVIYYSILIAWVIKAFFDAFGDAAPWADEGVTGQIAIDYFMEKIIGTSTLGEDGTATRIVWANVGYLALTWLIIWAGIAFGSKITGRIAYMTMGIPIIVLFIFLFTAIGLEGASDGIKVYIGKWDMSVLTEQGDVWSQATTQIFFSIGVTFGIMTAFGSHCKRHEPAFLNSVVIATANSTFSVISGFAVFAALGHLAFLEGVPVEDLSYGGFSLVFGTWPVVVGTLPGGIHWVRLLFFDLFLLGIDSAFGFMEGIITVASDTPQFMNTPKWKVTGCFCLLSFLFSLMYATDAGLNWLNVVDYYINFVMILVGLFETLGAGWVYGIHDQLESVGYKAVYSWTILANFLPVIIACSLWFGIDGNEATWVGFVALIGFSFCGIGATAYFLRETMQAEPGKWTWGSIWWEVSFANIFKLRDSVQPTIQYIPDIWAYLIKGVIPHLLVILFVNAASTKNSEGDANFGHYGSYATKPFQVMGIATVVFTLFLLLVGVFSPEVYAPLAVLFEEELVIQAAKEELLNGSDNNVEENNLALEKAEEPEAALEKVIEEHNEVVEVMATDFEKK